VYIRALDLCRASVDVVAFTKGWGLTVLLEAFVDPNGERSSIFFKDDSLAPLCTALTLTDAFDQVHGMVLQEASLFMALDDLIVAITLPHVSPVNCARAMDRLKHLIALPESKDKHAWQQMRDTLHVSEEYLKFITDHSTGPRHGRPGHTPGSVTMEITRRAWILMNRYFEYRKRGSKPLSTSDFPLLIG
jgi:hypothetical protein